MASISLSSCVSYEWLIWCFLERLSVTFAFSAPTACTGILSSDLWCCFLMFFCLKLKKKKAPGLCYSHLLVTVTTVIPTPCYLGDCVVASYLLFCSWWSKELGQARSLGCLKLSIEARKKLVEKACSHHSSNGAWDLNSNTALLWRYSSVFGKKSWKGLHSQM